MQSGSIPGLVRRLLLLEALQQPVSWSMLAPSLQAAWQQQQHVDLARSAAGSCSSSSDSKFHAICGSWMPQLLRALLQPNDDVQLDDCTGLADLVARERRAVLNSKRQQQKLGAATAGSAAAANLAAAADRLSLDRYALVCLADPSCRYSLTCWVLAWHAALAQQGGHYDSAASR